MFSSTVCSAALCAQQHSLQPLLTRLVERALCAVWGVAGGAFVMGLPLLQGVTAFLATTSIATVGLALAYGIPIGLHVLRRKHLEPGPFSLGRYA